MTHEHPLITARNQRTEWFLAARFGMFIHWGLYAIPARGEWVRSLEKISNEAYQPYFEQFNPTEYQPREWAKLAKAAGMRYAVLTAKHHDGFCLFDSQLTDYKSTNTPAQRDLVREYVEAFRAEGLQVGLYYSLLDWHHPDYPAFDDEYHPMRGNEAYRDQPRDFQRYLDYMHGQIAELLTNYGKIDIMWFDFSYGELNGEAWRASELINKARSLQPDLIIDNRLAASGEGNNSFGTPNPEIYAGDFACPEQLIPPTGLVDQLGRSVPWEACITLNQHWGYSASDRDFKSSRQVVHGLIECVSKNGNLLLNVGPDAKGRIPAECQQILQEVGLWMAEHSESIYGCGRSQLEKPEWGRYTQRGSTIYAHIYERGIGPINFRGLNGKVKRARLIADNSEVKLELPWIAKDYADDVFLNWPSAKLPNQTATVVALELDEGQKIEQRS